jgi:hypothetical protein
MRTRSLLLLTSAAFAPTLFAATIATHAHAKVIETATTSTPTTTPNEPARRYGAMTATACERELRARGVSFALVPEARGVLLPMRLTGPIRGVTYHTGLPERSRATSPYEIVDCRLALALDDFSQILAEHDIVEVVHYSVYRPPTPRDLRGGGLGTRHPGALAIDAGSFIKKDGSKIVVEKDFHGGIGQRACGVAPPADANAKELREIVCTAADQKLFNVVLTPDYNWQHRNHFHLEVTPNVSWFIIH